MNKRIEAALIESRRLLVEARKYLHNPNGPTGPASTYVDHELNCGSCAIAKRIDAYVSIPPEIPCPTCGRNES